MDVKVIEIDAKGQTISDGLFADAYRATIPVLAPAKFVTISIHPLRLKELGMVSGPVSDVVEVGSFTEGGRSVQRVIAVPVEVHPKDGAELAVSDKADPTSVSFLVNGVAHVRITNLKVTDAEAKAAKAAADKAAADAKSASDKAQEAAKKEAFDQGVKEAELEKAKAAGKASVAGVPEKVQ